MLWICLFAEGLWLALPASTSGWALSSPLSIFSFIHPRISSRCLFVVSISAVVLSLSSVPKMARPSSHHREFLVGTMRRTSLSSDNAEGTVSPGSGLSCTTYQNVIKVDP